MAAIGVLALQGGFAAHASMLKALGHRPVEVRTAPDLCGLQGLVLPGGESTVMLRLLVRSGLDQAIVDFASEGQPILATCAGLILLARVVRDPEQGSLALLDVEVSRNAWGRQVQSFCAHSDDGARRLIFIRAPRIKGVGPGVEVGLRFSGEPVLVRQGRITAATFHPELTGDPAVHQAVFGEAP